MSWWRDLTLDPDQRIALAVLARPELCELRELIERQERCLRTLFELLSADLKEADAADDRGRVQATRSLARAARQKFFFLSLNAKG